eukprot:4082561-Amphidinium_carterae.1
MAGETQRIFIFHSPPKRRACAEVDGNAEDGDDTPRAHGSRDPPPAMHSTHQDDRRRSLELRTFVDLNPPVDKQEAIHAWEAGKVPLVSTSATTSSWSSYGLHEHLLHRTSTDNIVDATCPWHLQSDSEGEELSLIHISEPTRPRLI